MIEITGAQSNKKAPLIEDYFQKNSKDRVQQSYVVGGGLLIQEESTSGSFRAGKQDRTHFQSVIEHQTYNNELRHNSMKVAKNDEVKRVLQMRRLLESRRIRYFNVKERIFVLAFLRNRAAFHSLCEVMEGENKVHTLIWLKASGALCQVRANPGYYLQLKNSELLYPNPDFQQVELDVLRTYPHIEDAKMRTKLQSQLRNVLLCFLKRNAKIGYFQGMNFLAAHLLSQMRSEEYAFWTLCQIIEQYLPLDYFSNFFGVLVDQKVLDEQISRMFPELAEHFERIEFSTELLSMSWFVQLLVNKMPVATVNLIWDMFLIEDTRCIFRAILTAIKQVHDQCLNIDRFDEALLMIQQFIAEEFEPEMLLNSLGPRISFEDFEASRARQREDIIVKLKAQLDKGRIMMPEYDPRKQFIDKFFTFGGLPEYYELLAAKTNLEEHKLAAKMLAQPGDVYIPYLMRYYTCDPSWPICLYDFTHRNLNPKFNTLKVEQPLTSFIRDGHFSQNKLSQRATEQPYHDPTRHSGPVPSNQLLIQRNMHLCHMPGFQVFQEHFKARYNAKDSHMLINEFLKFDVDDEVDAIGKAKAFVREICKPLVNLPQNLDLTIEKEPSSDSRENDLLASTIQMNEEETKENASRRIKNRQSRVLPPDTNGSSPESLFISKGTNTESQGSSGSRSKQTRFSLFQQAVRNTIIEDITKNKSFRVAQSMSSGGHQKHESEARDVNRMTQSMGMSSNNEFPEESKIAGRFGSQANLIGIESGQQPPVDLSKQKRADSSTNPSMNESFFADWDLSHAQMGLPDPAMQRITRTFSLVRNNIIDTNASVHLKQIDEDGELVLLDGLGADHETSSPDTEDEDEILVVDKHRNIGSAFQSGNFHSRQLSEDSNEEDYLQSKQM